MGDIAIVEKREIEYVRAFEITDLASKTILVHLRQEAVRRRDLAESKIEATVKANYAAWQESIRQYLEQEELNRCQWREMLEAWLSAFVRQAAKINAFLDEHPDLQLIYSKVDGERESQRQREIALKSWPALLADCEKWRLLSEKEMPLLTN